MTSPTGTLTFLLATGLLATSLTACVNQPTQAERWRAELDTYVPSDSLPLASSPYPGLYSLPRRSLPSHLSSGHDLLGVYDVSSLLMEVRDFSGPEIGDLRHPDDRPQRETSDDLRRGLDEDTLIELIRSGVMPGTWDDEDVSIAIENGLLIVRHP